MGQTALCRLSLWVDRGEERGAPLNGSLKGGASGIGRRKRRLGDLSALLLGPFLNSFFAFSSLFLFSVSVLPFPLRFKRVLKPAGAFSVVLPVVLLPLSGALPAGF